MGNALGSSNIDPCHISKVAGAPTMPNIAEPFCINAIFTVNSLDLFIILWFRQEDLQANKVHLGFAHVY